MILPSRSTRPSALVLVSTNQMLPSGWAAIARGWLSWLGNQGTVTLRSMVMRPTPIPSGFAEPHHAVAACDRERTGAGRDPVYEFSDASVGRDAADLTGVGFGKPDIAVGTDQRAVRSRIRRR